MAKRIYFNKVKKWALDNKIITASGAGGTLIGLLFLYLSVIGAITITGYSGDIICSGTLDDPCYAFINFTANEDVFIYPIDYDPYGRNITIDFDPNVESWKVERSWGRGWREINMTTNCKGTWCGAPDNTGRTKYSIAFREGRDYRIRITVLKINPDDNIKWSAFGIDPTFFGLNNESLKKEYNESKREISFNSKIDNSNKIKIKLKTELVHNVIRGNDRTVAITKIENNYGNYPIDLILGPIEFINSKTNETFNRDFHYEYKKSIGFKTVNDYGDEICVTSFDKINNSETIGCVNLIIGTHQEEQFEWVNLNTSEDMPKGNLTVALVTDVLPSEKIEWIPTYLGIESPEFAGWQESWNVDLISYYKMDESSGAVLDAHASNDGTNNGATPNVAGKILTAYDFESTESDFIDLTDMDYVTANRLTVSAWIKGEVWPSTGEIVTHSTNTGVRAFILEQSQNKSRLVVWNSAGTAKAIITSFVLNVGQWYHVVGVWDGTNILLYVNGSLEDSTAQSGTIRNDNGVLQIGKNSVSGLYFDGLIDEVFISKRAWNSSEISDLYDAQKDGFVNGSYTADFDVQCTNTINTNWLITDAQTCDNQELDIGTGIIVISTGNLTLINSANVTSSGINITQNGEKVFIYGNSNLIIM